jgi:hypothetical protein
VELATYDLMSALKEANSFAVRSVYLGFSDVDDLSVLKKFRVVVGRLNSQNNWRTVFNSKQLL